MGTVVEKLQKLIETKNAIKVALRNKGVTIEDADTFASYADKINGIAVDDGSKDVLKGLIEGSITEIAIPEGTTEIRGSAFRGFFTLESVIVPSTVTSIGFGAFYNCPSLRDVVIPNSINTVDEDAFSCSGVTSLTFPDGTSFGQSVFSGCKSLERVICNEANLSGSVGNMFSGCSALKEALFFNNQTDTGYETFSRCTSLVNVVVPAHITSGGMYTFEGCSSLEKIDYLGVTNIIGNEFGSCNSLTSIIFRYGSVVSRSTDITASNFLAGGTGCIYVPQSLVANYKAHRDWSYLGDRVRAIEDYPDICG